MTKSEDSSFFKLPGFSLYRGDTNSSIKKHGAGLYIAERLKQLQVETQLPNVAVVHLVELDVFVISTYRPPSYSQQENDTLMQFVREFSVGKDVVIMGDLNLPTIKWPMEISHSASISRTDRAFLDCFIECGLSQWVNFGTFLSSDNVLDLVLTSNEDRVCDVYSLPVLPKCQHYPVVCEMVYEDKQKEDENIPKLAWHKTKFNKINQKLLNIDWEMLFQDLDADSCYILFRDIIVELIEPKINNFIN